MTNRAGLGIDELDTPVLMIDAAALERNITRMQNLARSAEIAYRPHAKAHKSPVIARMQIEAGACGICCAKLGEAEVMAGAGIADIHITTPVIGASKIARLTRLAGQARISVVVDDAGNIADLSTGARAVRARLDVFIEIDVGQGRCGVPPGKAAADLADAVAAADRLRLKGLQGYQGRIQMTPDFAAREAAARAALDALLETAALVRGRGYGLEVLTGGGTGTSAIDAAAKGLTEIQPGGYIFMDSRYGEIGWTGGRRTPFEKSLSLLSTVISRPAKNRAILDMGYKAVSSDGGLPVPVDLPGATFSFAGEEHGQLSWDGGPCPLAVGDKVAFWPSHCDTTVNLYDQFVVTRAGRVEALWDIAARGKVQ